MKVLVVVAQRQYQDRELAGTLAGLSAANIDYQIASTKTGTCEGKLGGSVEASVSIRDASPDDFQGIVFIGGPGSAELAKDASAQKLAQAFAHDHKPMGAIC